MTEHCSTEHKDVEARRRHRLKSRLQELHSLLPEVYVKCSQAEILERTRAEISRLRHLVRDLTGFHGVTGATLDPPRSPCIRGASGQHLTSEIASESPPSTSCLPSTRKRGRGLICSEAQSCHKWIKRANSGNNNLDQLEFVEVRTQQQVVDSKLEEWMDTSGFELLFPEDTSQHTNRR